MRQSLPATALNSIGQARFSDPRLADRGDHLPATRTHPLQRAAHLRQFMLAAYEPRESTPRGGFKARAQRTQPGNLVYLDKIAHAPDPRRPQPPQRKVARAQSLGSFGHRDRANRRQRLHPRGQAGAMADRRIFDVLAGLDRAHHDFAGVHAYPHLERRAALGAQAIRVTPHLFLHP